VYKPRSIGPHEDIALLQAAKEHGEFTLLYGPPGTGKTALAEAAFGSAGGGLETIVCTADTTEMDLLGTFTQDPRSGNFKWMPGPLHRSVLRGVPLLVDEIALADPRALSVLYPLMDGRGVLQIPQNPDLEPIPVTPGWFIIGAYNPDVPGAVLSDALRDRFTHHLLIDTDWDLAIELGVGRRLVTVAKNLDEQRLNGVITWSPQLRSLLMVRDLTARYGEDYALAALISKAPAQDRDTIVSALRLPFPGVCAARLGVRYGS
jgi:MoxR-like ATPase